MVSLKSESEEETMKLAARLAKRAGRGAVILLDGPLGSGKTTFVRGFLRGLGFRGHVPSPTFTIVNEYRRLRPPVYHLDMYRVENGELGNLGLEEYFEDVRAAVLIEWPEVVRLIVPADRIEISFRHVSGGGRGLRLRGVGPRSKAILRT